MQQANGPQYTDAQAVEALAVRAAAGDQDAMSQLYERYADPLYRYLHVRSGGDHARTEDACQDAWIRVVRAIGTYEVTGKGFPAWLFTIARNTLMDTYRRSTSRPETPTADMLRLDSPSIEVGPDEATLRREVAAQLAAAIRSLPAKQAQIVTLRFFDGLTVAETASVLGATEGSVKTSQHRALRTLAKILPVEMRILGASLPVTNVRAASRAGSAAAPGFAL